LQVTTLLDRHASIQMATILSIGYNPTIVQIENVQRGERP
jgi:hypothetical protein